MDLYWLSRFVLIQLMIISYVSCQQPYFQPGQMPPNQQPEYHVVPLNPGQNQHGSGDNQHFGQPQHGQGQNNPHFGQNQQPGENQHFGQNQHQYPGNAQQFPYPPGNTFQSPNGDDIPFGPGIQTDLSPELQERVLEKVNALVPDIVEAIMEREKVLEGLKTENMFDAGVVSHSSPRIILFLMLVLLLVLDL